MVRLVDTGPARPALTAAIDEVLLMSRVEGLSGDTVHLYRRHPSSVSIGYFQAADEVVDLEACRRDGVPVVRRCSGGGAIFTDDRQLVYALVIKPPTGMTAREGFALACGALVRALGDLGVEGAALSGVNDVLVGGRKVSGSAQAIRRGVHLVHGTVLVDADLDSMFTYLRPLTPKVEAEGLATSRARVTTLAGVLGAPPPMEAVKRAVAEGLASAVGGHMEVGTLTDMERARAEAMERERYTRPEWNLKR